LLIMLGACWSQKATSTAPPRAATEVRRAKAGGDAGAPLPTAFRHRTAPKGKPVAICTIGVGECDYYFRRVSACLHGKLPEEEWRSVHSSLHQVCKTWKLIARKPERRDSLIEECSRALYEAQKSFSKHNCRW
jgi:hypothetical protein